MLWCIFAARRLCVKRLVIALCLVFSLVGGAMAQDVISLDMNKASMEDLARTIASDPMNFMESMIEVTSVVADTLAFRANNHPFLWCSSFFLNKNAVMIVQSDRMIEANFQFWFKAKDGDQQALDFVAKVKNAPAVSASTSIDYMKGYVARPRGIQNMPFVFVITELRFDGMSLSGEFTDNFNN